METVILWASLTFVCAVAALLLRQDLHFVVGPRQRAEAVVIGHDRCRDDGTVVHAAIFAFTDLNGKRHEVADGLLAQTPRPAVSTPMLLVYPEARPDLARVPRPIVRTGIYLLVGYLGAVLVARLAGWHG